MTRLGTDATRGPKRRQPSIDHVPARIRSAVLDRQPALGRLHLLRRDPRDRREDARPGLALGVDLRVLHRGRLALRRRLRAQLLRHLDPGAAGRRRHDRRHVRLAHAQRARCHRAAPQRSPVPALITCHRAGSRSTRSPCPSPPAPAPSRWPSPSARAARTASTPSTFDFFFGDPGGGAAARAADLCGYRNSARIADFIGATGTTIIVRLSAFLLFCIGIQVFWNGAAELLGRLPFGTTGTG